MLNFKKVLLAVSVVAVAVLAVPYVYAAAEEDATGDIYVSPADKNATGEEARAEGESGFDTPGPFYIPDDDYAAGAQDDGTWAPDVSDTTSPETENEDGE